MSRTDTEPIATDLCHRLIFFTDDFVDFFHVKLVQSRLMYVRDYLPDFAVRSELV